LYLFGASAPMCKRTATGAQMTRILPTAVGRAERFITRFQGVGVPGLLRFAGKARNEKDIIIARLTGE
jgi:hypothetical protein